MSDIPRTTEPRPTDARSTEPDLDALGLELETLTTESVDSAMSALDLLDTPALVAAMHADDRGVPDALVPVLPAIAVAVDAITERMRRGGRLVYIGAGTSGRLGVLDASECPPTFGIDPSLVIGIIAGGDTAIRTAVERAEDDESAGAADLAAIGLQAVDTVVGLSASGRTPYVVGGLLAARRTGALTIAVACNAPSKTGSVAEIAIDVVVGPEFVAGSTRLKAGTAQKLVLNMLSTLTMVRLGKTYGNVMVDLRATNAKLLARARRTVVAITGVGSAEAATALDAAGGSVKEAVFAILTGRGPAEARAVLLTRSGRLRDALESVGVGVGSGAGADVRTGADERDGGAGR